MKFQFKALLWLLPGFMAVIVILTLLGVLPSLILTTVFGLYMFVLLWIWLDAKKAFQKLDAANEESKREMIRIEQRMDAILAREAECLKEGRHRAKVEEPDTSSISFVSQDGEPLTINEWIELCQDIGIGRVLVEHTIPRQFYSEHKPLPDGDVIVRTKWFGTIFPECSIHPFGTAISTSVNGPWVELCQYDTQAAAELGHGQWVAQLIRPAAPLEVLQEM